MQGELSTLIVDDNSITRQLLRVILRDTRLHVIAEAHDGQSALHIIEVHRPKLVLLDIVMEGMSGIDVLKTIKTDYPDTIVMMISAVASEELVKSAISFGADGFLVKPFRPAQVIDELKYTLAHAGQ